uniref:Uncharacterized protein n=1 Tax=Arundo donax TaxID=35708 RepID=A0A0A9F798_ARUDO
MVLDHLEMFYEILERTSQRILSKWGVQANKHHAIISL